MSTDKKAAQMNIDALQEELEELKKQNQEYLSGWQRARADYSNFQKELEKRQKEMIEFANAATISEILPVYGNLKLALKHIPEDQRENEYIKGLEQIKKQFVEFLKKFNIEEIGTVGEKFDPNFHEAVTYEEKEGFEEGIIFEEISSGYMLNGNVIEPAKVKVAK